MHTDTPANYPHRPVVTMADKVARAMAEGDTPRQWPSGRPRPAKAATAVQIGAELGADPSYVRAVMMRIRRKLGDQAC